MIKRKKGVKAIIMVIVMIMFIISAVPVFAASYLNEVSVLDDFVVQVVNPSKKAYKVTLNIVYQDENGDTLYAEEVTKKVEAFETMTIDAKDYYNSEKIEKVVAEITTEEKTELLNRAYYLFIGAGVLLVLFIVFRIIANCQDSNACDAISIICLIGAVIVAWFAIITYLIA